MLYINYLQMLNNYQILSLRPQCIGSATSSFLFNATNKDTFAQYAFYATDISDSPGFYSKFNIISSTASDPLNGIIDIEPGEYTLDVYELLYNVKDFNFEYTRKCNSDILNIVGTHSAIETYPNNGTPKSVYINQNRV